MYIMRYRIYELYIMMHRIYEIYIMRYRIYRYKDYDYSWLSVSLSLGLLSRVSWTPVISVRLG